MKIGAQSVQLVSPGDQSTGLPLAGARRIAQSFLRPTATSGISDELTLLYGRLKQVIGNGTQSPDKAIGGSTGIAAARSAHLEIVGGAGATATTTATLSVEGSRGRFLVQLEAGQSLETVARKINRHTRAAHIVAGVSGNNLVLSSLDVGRKGQLRVEQLSAEGQSYVRGVNDGQVALFQVLAQPASGSETLAGTVVATAQQASLRYLGASGAVVVADASFLLHGDGGTVTVAITAGESLATVMERINADSAITGVTATVEGDDLLFQSTAAGGDATVQVELVDATYTVTTEGVNASQLASFDVNSVEPGEHALSGSVLQAAAKAELVLQGTTGATVVDGATFELRGAAGAATISITAGESLSDVADRINTLTGSTGVQATVSGNDLIFRSVNFGSAETVEVELQAVDYHTTVSGTNSQQLTGFQVQSFTTGATETLNGSITQTAGTAQLTFSGNILGQVNRNATFTLTGSNGSTSISVNRLDTLQSLVNSVNVATTTTGVRATKQGNTVIFESTGVGSAAFVQIQPTQGQFPVSGGDGKGLAHGTDAVAVINGQTVTASGNQFNFSTAFGSYAFTAVQGYTGSLSPITIQSLPGQFDVVGGNGDGTAAGLDALVVVNGVQFTGVGNHVAVNDSAGQYELEFQAGFTGAFDTILVRSEVVGFEIEGGNAAGLAAGADAVAIINGVQHVGSSDGFTVHDREGTYLLQFADGFSGDFDAITITANTGPLALQGGQLGSLLRGADALVTFHGEPLRINRSAGAVSGAADFAIARSLSRRLYTLAETDPGALAAILSPNSLATLPQRQSIAGLLLK
jgi:hypothetical protein